MKKECPNEKSKRGISKQKDEGRKVKINEEERKVKIHKGISK